MTIFKDRTEAGKKLAEVLGEFKNTNAVVLALPRGGVAVGAEVAHTLNLPLDIIVTRKIGAPGNSEYAIGAIDIEGNGVFNESETANVDKKWLENEIAKEKKEAERRWKEYRGTRGPLDLANKTAIIVDDIVDTAGTLVLGAEAVLKNGAKEVYACVTHPVLSGPAIERLEKSPIAKLVVTNTIRLSPNVKNCKKIEVLDVAPLLGEAIRRIYQSDSVSSLFI